jgi:hypothetical protein
MDSFQKRMDDAYVAGDTDAILRLLSEPPHAPVSEPSLPALNPTAFEFVPTLRPQDEPLPQLDEAISEAGEEINTEEEEDDNSDVLATLTATYPDAAATGVVAALLGACGGDVNSAAASLADLDNCGALIDTEAYTEAVAEFNLDFPSLGGSSKTLERPSPMLSATRKTYSDGKLLFAVRLRHLIECFAWAPPDACERALQSSVDSAAAVVALRRDYPKPPEWDAQQAANRNSIIRAAVTPLFQKSVNTTDSYNWKDTGPAKWVQTGSHVTALYKATRAEARDEARRRNKFFGEYPLSSLNMCNACVRFDDDLTVTCVNVCVANPKSHRTSGGRCPLWKWRQCRTSRCSGARMQCEHEGTVHMCCSFSSCVHNVPR